MGKILLFLRLSQNTFKDTYLCIKTRIIVEFQPICENK